MLSSEKMARGFQLPSLRASVWRLGLVREREREREKEIEKKRETLGDLVYNI